MSDIEIVADGIREHARRVEEAARGVDVAANAGQQVSLNPTAYGMLCGPILYPTLLGIEEMAVHSTRKAGRALDETSMKLREMAGNYCLVDQIAADNSNQVRAEMTG